MTVQRRKALRWALILGALGVGAALLGLAVAASGLIPIKASSGHWAITEWMLHFSMKRSIATHTLGEELPPLNDPALILRGAGHYEGGCRPCHGAPGTLTPRIARAMLPPPPELTHAASKWQPEELFYIVKHGIKFTGMPAWPNQKRDDEVRAVVAFMLAMPELNATAYQQLVYGPVPVQDNAPALAGLTARAQRTLEGCARCHGAHGDGRENSAFPKLSGQRAGYMEAALTSYADDRRMSGIMQPIAAALDVEQRRELASYYARAQRATPPPSSESAERISRGREIALRGIPARRVAACKSCHGPKPDKDNPKYPLLTGQYADYLLLQLQLFQRGERGGSENHHLMLKVAPRLELEQMRDVAAYYSAGAPE